MIDVKELRIGNWVMNQSGNFKNIPVREPCQINMDDFAWVDLYLPIPLTEEILLKCGFDKHPIEFEFLTEPIWKNKFIELWEVGGDPNQYQVAIIGKMIPMIIRSVHQLQNLYYCLTGKELTYTP